MRGSTAVFRLLVLKHLWLAVLILVCTGYARGQSAPTTQGSLYQRTIDVLKKPMPEPPPPTDPEARKRCEELRKAGVPQPAPFIRPMKDMPQEIQNIYGGVRGGVTAPRVMPGVDRSEFPGSSAGTATGGPGRPVRLHDRITPDQSLWIGWWETHRDRYWPTRQREPIPQRPVPPQVQAALLRDSSSTDKLFRSQAALALAIVHHPKAMEVLPRLTQDADKNVALHAWAGIGLLNTPQARTFLETRPRRDVDLTGWLLAVAVSEKPSEATWRAMPSFSAQGPLNPVDLMMIRAYQTHRPPVARELLLRQAQVAAERIRRRAPTLIGAGRNTQRLREEQTDDQIRMDQFMLGLMRMNHPDDVRTFLAYSGGSKAREQIPQDLKTPSSPILPLVLPFIDCESAPFELLNGARNTFRRLIHASPWLLRHGLVPKVLTVGEPYTDSTGGVWIPRRQDSVGPGEHFALLGLGQMGGPEDVTLFRNILSMNDVVVDTGIRAPTTNPRTTLERQSLDYNMGGGGTGGVERAGGMPFDPHNPLRATSAIALGLYLHNGGAAIDQSGALSVQTGQPILPAGDHLITYFQMATETNDLRAACALALGLSGKTEYATRIDAALKKMEPGQALVWGYGVLALGMLNDPRAIEHAARNLGPARQKLDTNVLVVRDKAGAAPMPFDELMSRRAAVSGLAALGDPRALPILYGEWGKDASLNLEVTRAIARCTVFPPIQEGSDPPLDPFVEAMLKLMVQERSRRLGASAAASLGLLYESNASARWGDVTSDTDFSQSGAVKLFESVLGISNPTHYSPVETGGFTRAVPKQN